ncbi:hypothetical protein EVAR_62060_1 [Eumeta japonica]|uniref:Uncharacterized protein n=1 Tax=Eumeta variegata TaxID=151549 RepID=A0A4C1YWX4_EUMVA|nr:hypothetical protein EVAR_62060_1 [Eumeta japonica]
MLGKQCAELQWLGPGGAGTAAHAHLGSDSLDCFVDKLFEAEAPRRYKCWSAKKVSSGRGRGRVCCRLINVVLSLWPTETRSNNVTSGGRRAARRDRTVLQRRLDKFCSEIRKSRDKSTGITSAAPRLMRIIVSTTDGRGPSTPLAGDAGDVSGFV